MNVAIHLIGVIKMSVYKYKDLDIAEISEDLHTELMKYWTEDKKDIQLPVENVFNYLCYVKEDKSWDAICVMKTNDGFHLFGEEFIHKEYALKWIAGEYEDTDDLKKEDRKAGK